MNRLPTLMIIDHEPSHWFLSHLLSSLLKQLHVHCDLPIKFISANFPPQIGESLLPSNCVINVEQDAGTRQSFAELVAMGVTHDPHAPGWIILPTNVTPKVQTIRQIADQLISQPTVYPTYHCLRGFPIGFSSEFFSELSRLKSNRDFDRLLTKYPSLSIEVDDAGVRPDLGTDLEVMPPIPTISFTAEGSLNSIYKRF